MNVRHIAKHLLKQSTHGREVPGSHGGFTGDPATAWQRNDAAIAGQCAPPPLRVCRLVPAGRCSGRRGYGSGRRAAPPALARALIGPTRLGAGLLPLERMQSSMRAM